MIYGNSTEDKYFENKLNEYLDDEPEVDLFKCKTCGFIGENQEFEIDLDEEITCKCGSHIVFLYNR